MIREGRASGQWIGVEISMTIEAHPAEDAVVQAAFDDIHVTRCAGDQEHPPVPQDVADVGTGLVVCREARQLIIASIGLMYFLDGVGFVGCSVDRDAVIQGTTSAGDVHFGEGNIVPQT